MCTSSRVCIGIWHLPNDQISKMFMGSNNEFQTWRWNNSTMRFFLHSWAIHAKYLVVHLIWQQILNAFLTNFQFFRRDGGTTQQCDSCAIHAKYNGVRGLPNNSSGSGSKNNGSSSRRVSSSNSSSSSSASKNVNKPNFINIWK